MLAVIIAPLATELTLVLPMRRIAVPLMLCYGALYAGGIAYGVLG